MLIILKLITVFCFLTCFAFAQTGKGISIDSLLYSSYIEVGLEYSAKIYDDDNKTREEFLSLSANENFVISINKETRFLPTLGMALHYGLADNQNLGLSIQLGFGLEFDNPLLFKNSIIKLEPVIGLGSIPVNYRPKLNLGTLLGFSFGYYFPKFGCMFGVKEYFLEKEDINTIFSFGIRWCFK